ncbi:MAG TPA: PAS domain S-box protein, partial [Candidatus Hydrogenedentes bacterium]|nr:PAS domain S-box protein [Candidatus Hydrogenedentota bacterium]
LSRRQVLEEEAEQKKQEQEIRNLNQNLEQQVAKRSAELRQQKAYLDEAVTMGQIAYWEYDPAAGEFIFNDAIYRILRTTVQEEGGYRIPASIFQERFLAAPEIKNLTTYMFNMLSVELDLLPSFEMPIRYRDGVLGHLMVRIRIEKDSENRIVHVFGIAQDISTQKEMKAKLEHREQMYRMLFETSPSPVFVVDSTSGILIDANERALEFTGLSMEEVRGSHFTQLHDNSSQLAVKTTFRSISNCGGMESVIATLRHHSGKYRSVIIHTRAVACGEKVYAVGIMTDIEEHKTMIREAINIRDASPPE